MRKTWIVFVLTALIIFLASGCSQTVSSGPPASNTGAQDPETEKSFSASNRVQPPTLPQEDGASSVQEPVPPERPSFSYPDAVRGIYVTGHSAGGEKLSELVKLVDSTDLNAMVIDVKDDYGNITYRMGGVLEPYSKPYIKDPQALLKTLAEHRIYPIARIVVFKDSVLAGKHPEFSFQSGGKLWRNRRGEAFVNPFEKRVWEHNLAVAKEAAKLGFQEIQFDYVRFPEGFEKRDQSLSYSMGDYTREKLEPRLMREWEAAKAEWERKRQQALAHQPESGSSEGLPPEPQKPVYDAVAARVTAVTDFVEYARKELEPFQVKVSVDIFGYTATLPEAPGIGQNFTLISEHVDVISSMIYPSHWGPGYFNIPKPDVEPYRLVQEYVKMEKQKLMQLSNPPVSRPWIQDFTASWLGKGNYIPYGKREVELQIKALNEAGIKEFLLWNAGNDYTPDIDYTPLG